jgi:hypothetical protein
MVQVISFYFEYLTRESGIADAILLPGSMTYLFLHGGESHGLACMPLHM